MRPFGKVLRWLNVYVLVCCLVVCHCGGENTTDSDSSTISIINDTFLPASVTTQAGNTVFFINYDSVSHHILSESSPNSFDNTEIFDSDIILAGTTGQMELPSDALAGDTFYFYCGLHEESMVTPNGEIIIE